MKLAVRKQKQRYEYIFHQDTPEELDTNPDELSVEYEELKRLWRENCGRYRTNPNHHFHISRGMIRDNQVFQICEITDNWKLDIPSKFYVIREIHKQGNHKFVDMVELYLCPNCEVYCRSQNSIVLPFKLWKKLELSNLPVSNPIPEITS
jgi:hypothetical protein